MKLEDLKIGDKFLLGSNKKFFTKENDLGWYFAICNCKDRNGKWVHIHPSFKVQKL